jgi:hypothetical protein
VRWSKVAGLAVLFVAGALLAGAATADTTTETTTETATTTETTTLPATTVVTTATVQQTTTRRVIVTTSPTTTASESSSSGGTPTWVWVLLGILGAIALVSLIALLLRGGGGPKGVAPEERRRRLDGAVASWAMQGWALDSQGADSAVLRRQGELMLVSVDPAGNVSTRPLPNQP